jgi:hypothetical protein
VVGLATCGGAGGGWNGGKRERERKKIVEMGGRGACF